eukprot:CAMPEP_0119156184 /NCGR_PEP_ID=MMETSP1310-20130426/52127_1 /TAXON_ID=464262 /ORGANISM="Genus nov. species nov., Strain RCC2339" /LENGTH=82 /DNA_ID=CAMNT_0007148793 /DNA_START=1071 /DNA_END=1319 /DNA_ORIENTATION=-
MCTADHPPSSFEFDYQYRGNPAAYAITLPYHPHLVSTPLPVTGTRYLPTEEEEHAGDRVHALLAHLPPIGTFLPHGTDSLIV